MRQAVLWSLAVSVHVDFDNTGGCGAELGTFHRWIWRMGVSWRYNISSQSIN
jgi:hypothetical protein